MEGALKQARAAWNKIDRFPYREDAEAPLAEAVAADPNDWVARHALACLLYYRQRPNEAIEHWEAAVAANPTHFSTRRALGLAYASADNIDKAAAQLEQAIALNPAHLRTINDLSSLYAKAGRFDDQLKVLQTALARSPNDDDLTDSILTVHLIRGDYAAAARIIDTHRFSPRHRSYELRDKYRLLRLGSGAQAFNKGDYAEALKLFTSAANPPESLGMDDFVSQVSPRIQYHIARALEALNRGDEARAAYEEATQGVQHLTGDRDSWSAENFYMVLALEKLGRNADPLKARFEAFGNGERNDHNLQRRAAALYLLALVEKSRRRNAQALLQSALEAMPDHLAARMALRGDVLKE